jgi:hypothetical protein
MKHNNSFYIVPASEKKKHSQYSPNTLNDVIIAYISLSLTKNVKNPYSFRQK